MTIGGKRKQKEHTYCILGLEKDEGAHLGIHGELPRRGEKREMTRWSETQKENKIRGVECQGKARTISVEPLIGEAEWGYKVARPLMSTEKTRFFHAKEQDYRRSYGGSHPLSSGEG